jgi:hypothetical protein
MWFKLSQIILRNRIIILSLLFIVTVIMAFFAITSLKLDNKYGNMLPKESPSQSSYLKFKEMFGEDGGTLVFAIQTDSLYTEKNFKKWKELGDKILAYDGIESVVSEANLYTIDNNTEASKFEARKIFTDTTYATKSIDSIKREIRNNPLYNDLLYTIEGNVSLMMIGVSEVYLADPKKAQVVVEIESIANEYEKYFGQIHYAGLPHIRVIIAKRVMSEMYIFIALAIAVTSLLLYIFFRSLRVVMFCNVVVFTAVIWSLGIIGMLGFKLSILMALIPPLMIVIGIPNCIFLLTKFHREVADHGNKTKALSRVIQKIGNATFLTNLTTALGFSTFIFTNSEKLIEFGIIASVNIIMVFILSITIIPIVFSLAKPPKNRHLRHLDRTFTQGVVDKLVSITSGHRTKAYLVTIGIIAICVIGLFKVEATGNLTSDLPADDPILLDVNFIQDNFKGAIPFEIMIDYKNEGRLLKKSTLQRVDEVQDYLKADSVFSKSISYVNVIKVINMAYYGNNPDKYDLISSRDKRRLKTYFDNLDLSKTTGSNITLNELVDTTNTTLRVRMQIRDLGSYEIAEKVDSLRKDIGRILNPEKQEIERLFNAVKQGEKAYIDSLIFNYSGIYNNLTANLSNGDAQQQFAFDSDTELIKTFYNKENFLPSLRTAINEEYLDFEITGTSVVAAEGTQYLVKNLLTSLLIAIVIIAILMSFLFRSWRMVIISLIPNFIPLLVTAAIMGFFHIPVKPSTILVFSIAFGISVDDTIHFLAKYRLELKHMKWDLKTCVLTALRETGLSMFYTSIVLFFGFSMFALSQFGGTQALGLLVSLTLVVAMITNLVVLPSLLLTLEKRVATKAFQEPYIDIYDEEEDIEFDELQIESKEIKAQIKDRNPKED